MYKLYKITNQVNNKSYIGITKLDVDERLNTHIRASTTPKYPVQFAIAKYGSENFTVETLCIADSKEYISNLEESAINLYKSHITQNGYNVAEGGYGGNLGDIANRKRSKTILSRSKEEKERLAKLQSDRQTGKTKLNDAGRLSQSIAVKGNQFAKGLKHSQETKEKISKANKNPKSQITRQRMSESAIINDNSKRFTGRNACCLCCRREWDIGNYTQHIKRKK